ncbi:MAG TPA: AAA family ATPase [Sphingobium sp.]|uniref:AAA family ATPase n=1 Tax=Sphingobium sp. TaxID=1912891 RepID=UPI002ED2F245
MRFLKLEVEDIFAYRGPSTIDLSRCTDARNIVVVQGRNGHGKTSLLNAVKLLFLGLSDSRLRRVGVGSTELSSKQYVLGQAGRWYGVFNTLAKEEGAPARVALTWLDGERDCRAERIFWPLRGATDYREQLNVTVDRQELPPTEAHAFIQGILPKEVVPFFFFDGEQIQSLADAEIGREQSEIERLLRLSFIAHVIKEIDKYGGLKRKAGLPETVRAEITAAEGAQRTAEARIDAAERARVFLEEEIEELDREKHLIEAERVRLRGGLSEDERRRMEMRIATLSGQREAIGNRIALEIPPEAPALANLGLVRRAFAMLEEQLSGTADAPLATRLHRTLPEAVMAALRGLAPPVDLTDDQELHVRAQLASALVEAGVARSGAQNPLLASLSPRKIKALRDRFLLWTDAGEGAAAGQADLLRQIRQVAHEEQQLRQELDEAEITSEDARRRYALLTRQLEGIEAAAREKIVERTSHANTEAAARREAAVQSDLVQKLYAEQEQVIRDNAAYQISRTAKHALESFRDERRLRIRASVERRLNEKAGILMGPSQLVKEVNLDPHFSLSYLDEHGDPVARHSLSAGMRQLAAMSLLWALKEEAQRPLPVVIDTPLGRIDRENRALLMSEYFPNAGLPLILLPTNSELNEEDLALLDDSIAARYQIQNVGGTSAQIIPITVTGSRHG